MVRHTWVTDGTEQDAVKASPLKDSKPILRHHSPLTQVALCAPVELLRVQVEVAMHLSEGREGLDALRDDILPNAVTRQHGDLIVSHLSYSFPVLCPVPSMIALFILHYITLS